MLTVPVLRNIPGKNGFLYGLIYDISASILVSAIVVRCVPAFGAGGSKPRVCRYDQRLAHRYRGQLEQWQQLEERKRSDGNRGCKYWECGFDGLARYGDARCESSGLRIDVGSGSGQGDPRRCGRP